MDMETARRQAAQMQAAEAAMFWGASNVMQETQEGQSFVDRMRGPQMEYNRAMMEAQLLADIERRGQVEREMSAQLGISRERLGATSRGIYDQMRNPLTPDEAIPNNSIFDQDLLREMRDFRPREVRIQTGREGMELMENALRTEMERETERRMESLIGDQSSQFRDALMAMQYQHGMAVQNPGRPIIAGTAGNLEGGENLQEIFNNPSNNWEYVENNYVNPDLEPRYMMGMDPYRQHEMADPLLLNNFNVTVNNNGL